MPRWLQVYKRVWIWLGAVMAVGWFVLAAITPDRFLVILFSATGGATIAFLYHGIMFRFVVAPRLKRVLPPDSNGPAA
jgi:hypothetical protein